jgi:hypothetical protein
MMNSINLAYVQAKLGKIIAVSSFKIFLNKNLQSFSSNLIHVHVLNVLNI